MLSIKQLRANFRWLSRFMKSLRRGRFSLEGVDNDLARAYEADAKPDKAAEAYHRVAVGPLHSPGAWLRLAVIDSRARKAKEAASLIHEAERGYQDISNLGVPTQLGLSTRVCR